MPEGESSRAGGGETEGNEDMITPGAFYTMSCKMEATIGQRQWDSKGGVVGSSGIVGVGSGAGDSSDKPSEKIPVLSFAGHAGEEGEIGSAARSYLRHVQAWERVTRLREHHRGVAPYSALKERARLEAEALDLDKLSSASGVSYFKGWLMDIEVMQAGRIMSQFCRVLRRNNDQSVRSFADRMVARLSEVTLPENVLA